MNGSYVRLKYFFVCKMLKYLAKSINLHIPKSSEPEREDNCPLTEGGQSG